MFDKKLETYQAVLRNFKLLKQISLKQQDDFHASMRHSKEVENKQAVIERENASLKERFHRASTELDRLKKKEMEFD